LLTLTRNLPTIPTKYSMDKWNVKCLNKKMNNWAYFKEIRERAPLCSLDRCNLPDHQLMQQPSLMSLS
jgi:hypothetical protein